MSSSLEEILKCVYEDSEMLDLLRNAPEKFATNFELNQKSLTALKSADLFSKKELLDTTKYTFTTGSTIRPTEPE